MKKLGYIDAVRGWAILLVITCHVGGHFPLMPYPIKKLTNFGWHGVQLFFLASAVTLSMSWYRETATYSISVKRFFIRRFFRIAPLYYAASGLYFIFDPPASGFSLLQWLRSALFINAWYPSWLPTTGGWIVVPGGWTISVEFTFYLVFPVVILFATSLQRSLALLLLSISLAGLTHYLATSWLSSFTKDEYSSFLYYWFPNQAPIFILGIALFFVLEKFDECAIGSYCTFIILAAVGCSCLIVAEYPTSQSAITLSSGLPSFLLASLIFSVFVFVLARGRPGVFVHPLIQKLGTLSFSCYILHFLVIDLIVAASNGLIDIGATNLKAVATLISLLVLSLASTVAFAIMSHRFIEQPCITLAKWLTSQPRIS